MDVLKLKSLMALHGDTVNSLAEYLGISDQGLRNKMKTDGNDFKQTEISKIMNRYQLSGSDIVSIFFAEKVSS